jgi:hypothetical protein
LSDDFDPEYDIIILPRMNGNFVYWRAGKNGMQSKLRKDLENYIREGNYPLHMPGHKRRLMPEEDLPYAWDFTEVSGTDDLHHAEGIFA